MTAANLRDFIIPSSGFLGRWCGLLARLFGDSLSIDRVNGGWTRGKIVGKPTIPGSEIKSRCQP